MELATHAKEELGLITINNSVFNHKPFQFHKFIQSVMRFRSTQLINYHVSIVQLILELN